MIKNIFTILCLLIVSGYAGIGTGSFGGGAVPASLGVGNVDAAGAVTIAAGGTNQNINLTPSGTGNLRFNSAYPFIEYALSGLTKAYLGVVNAPNALCVGSVSGDFVFRGQKIMFSVDNGSSGAFGVTPNGSLFVNSTITAAGTTGAQTINKGAGTVNFAAAGATTITVTNSLVTSSTQILLTRQKSDATATAISVNNKVSGAFDIVINSTATTELPVYFELRN